MKRAVKGHYGYLSQRKRNLLLLSLILGLVIAGIAVYGIIMKGTTKNWYSIIAAMLVIPLAMQIATLAPMLKHRDRPKEEYDRIRGIVGSGVLSTGLLIAGKDGKAFEIGYAYVHESGIYVFLPDEKLNAQEIEEYLHGFLRLSDIDGDITVYKNLKSFEKHLRTLSASDRDRADELLLKQEGVLRAISM